MLKGRSWAWEGRAILWKQRGGGRIKSAESLSRLGMGYR